MPEDYSVMEAAKLIDVAYKTLRSWIRTDWVSSHQNASGHLRISTGTIEDLRQLLQAHPGTNIGLVLKLRKLEVTPIQVAAQRIGVHKETLLRWIGTGGLSDILTTKGSHHNIPNKMVDHLAHLNRQPGVMAVANTLRIDHLTVYRWADKRWIRYDVLPNGNCRYWLEDVEFWQALMREPWQKAAVRRLLSAPEDIVNELALRGQAGNLSDGGGVSFISRHSLPGGCSFSEVCSSRSGRCQAARS